MNTVNKNDGIPKMQIVIVVLNATATFLASIAMGMSTIIIPVTLQHYNVTVTMIGVIMAIQTFVSLLAGFYFPASVRFFGMRRGLVLTTVLRVPPLLVLAFTSNIYIWIVAIVINGAGYFAFLMLLQTWISGINFKSNKGLMVSIYSTAISVGLAIGPIVLAFSDDISPMILPFFKSVITHVGLAVQSTPYEAKNQFNFILSGLFSLAALVPVLIGLSFVPDFKFDGKAHIWKTITHAKGPMFAIAMGGVSFFGVCTFITLYGIKNNLPLNESALLLTCFMMGSVLLETPLTWISDFIDRRYVIVIASFLSMVCAVYLPIAIYVTYQAYILLFLWGGVIGAVYSTSLALIGDKYTGQELIAANAGYSVMEAAGGVAGTLLIGFAMDLLGSDGLPYVIMLSSILYFSFALTRYKVV